MLLNALLAHQVDRMWVLIVNLRIRMSLTPLSFVFGNYTWSTDMTTEYTQVNEQLIPSRLPYTSMITGTQHWKQILKINTHIFTSGPLVGGPSYSYAKSLSMPSSAISASQFQRICPRPKIINGTLVNHGLPDADAVLRLKAWMDALTRVEDACVEVAEGSGQAFPTWFVQPDGILKDSNMFKKGVRIQETSQYLALPIFFRCSLQFWVF